MKIARASILTSFDPTTIGTKVLSPMKFEAFLETALKDYIFPENGQGFIHLPKEAYSTVSAGVANFEEINKKGYDYVEDFIIRHHRGRYGVYAQRRHAAPVEGLACVVYTLDAYNRDPDVKFAARVHIDKEKATHVLVAVLAFAGPKSPLTPWTFVHNVAGGNNAYIPATYLEPAQIVTCGIGVRDNGDYAQALRHDIDLLHKIITDAKEIEDYWSKWIVVAD